MGRAQLYLSRDYTVDVKNMSEYRSLCDRVDSEYDIAKAVKKYAAYAASSIGDKEDLITNPPKLNYNKIIKKLESMMKEPNNSKNVYNIEIARDKMIEIRDYEYTNFFDIVYYDSLIEEEMDLEFHNIYELLNGFAVYKEKLKIAKELLERQEPNVPSFGKTIGTVFDVMGYIGGEILTSAGVSVRKEIERGIDYAYQSGDPDKMDVADRVVEGIDKLSNRFK